MQWTLGYPPNLPGALIENNLTPAQLSPTKAFQQKMKFQEIATMIIAKASNDEKLRRAHDNIVEMCGNFNWAKDVIITDLPTAQAAYGPKITWRGPAIMVMIKSENRIYWLVHGTNLIRTSYEHIRPIIGPEGTSS